MNMELKTKITTGKVVLHYPNLTKKRENRQGYNSPSKYGTTIIISKDDKETIEKIQEAIHNAAVIGNIDDYDNFISPLKDGDTSYPGERMYENSLYMYVSTLVMPKIVDKNVHELFVSDDYLRGKYARLSIEFVAYKYNGKAGVSAKLHNVQVFEQSRLDELRSDPNDDFKD